MSKREDGGPAFPNIYGAKEPLEDGMSLRDYFAAQAITSCLPGAQVPLGDVEEYARWAYRMADAMLKERAK